MPRTSIPKASEHSIQAGFYREAGYEFRNDPTFRPVLFYAVLNGAWIGGSNSRAKSGLIQKYKDEGWQSGIADVHYDQPRGPHNKCVIEFKQESKRNTGIRSGLITGGLEPEQIKYLAAMWPYAFVRVCYTEQEALGAFRYYMSLQIPMKYRELLKAEENITVGSILGIQETL